MANIGPGMDPADRVRRGHTPFLPHISTQLPRPSSEREVITVIPQGFKITVLAAKVAAGSKHASAGRRGDAPTTSHKACTTTVICKSRWR